MSLAHYSHQYIDITKIYIYMLAKIVAHFSASKVYKSNQVHTN